MFSGIVEALVSAKNVESNEGLLRVSVEKPNDFNDIKIGDSVSVNGVCLTVERFNDQEMVFAIAAETLQVTSWDSDKLMRRPLNLERSLKVGDRIHGHWVSGHVDSVTEVLERTTIGESVILKLQLPKVLEKFCWKKGSVVLNGVSLTVNEVERKDNEESNFSVCLIPETLKKTNLELLKIGDVVNLEMDYFAKSIENMLIASGRMSDDAGYFERVRNR